MNFSFAGCGFLGIYHVGVASCLKEHAPHLVQNCKFAGASAGSMVACCLMSGCCLGDCTTFTLRLATKARSYSLGPLHPSFRVTKILREALREVLPANCHETASGRLFISFTRVSDRKNVVVSEYSSKEELIQALLCSAHVPLYSGVVPPTFRGVRYVDGGLSNNIPILNDETISISPFAGQSDICPRDDSSNPLHVHLANTSMQCSVNNLYRLSRALFPPHPEILSDMCQQGFDDCLKYLQSNNLLSCVRHLCVRSIVIPAPVEERSEEEESAPHSDTEHSDKNSCHECKKRVQVALLDNLPPVVGSALQEAIDSVNKGVGAYIYRNKALRLMSFMATPWFLPVDIAYTYALRFLEYLPHLPQDVQLLYRETADLLEYLVTNIHHKRRYQARFTCELAITETNYNLLDKDIFPATHHEVHEPVPHPSVPALPAYQRNLNFGFAVDFDSKLTEGGHHAHFVDGQLPVDHFTGHSHESTSSYEPCNQAFDTFEQCLHVSNQMESIMAYYYQDENNKGSYRYEEIYSLRDVEMEVPCSLCTSNANSHGSVENVNLTELSHGETEELPGHLELDIDQFVESRAKTVLGTAVTENSSS